MSDDDANPRRHRESILNADGDLTFGLAPTPSSYKTRGKIDDPGGAGVFGYNTATTGKNTGVRGRVDSSYSGAAGVFGDATAGTGTAFGVKGQTKSGDSGTAGVFGEATAGSAGYATGVFGTTEALGATAGTFRFPAPGVVGRSSYSGVTTGVWGVNRSGLDGTAGVEGTAYDAFGAVHGVRGQTRSDGVDAAGVYGEVRNASGDGYGVKGVASTSGTYGAGVRGEASGDRPAVVADGWLQVNKVGVSAYLDNGGNSVKIPDGSWTKVPFDNVATAGYGSGQFDTSTHEFTVPAFGHYYVEANVTWVPGFSDGQSHYLAVTVDGQARAYTGAQTQTDGNTSESSYVNDQVSKTLIGVQTGKKIAAEVRHDESGYDMFLDTDQTTLGVPREALNYFNVVRIG